MKGKGKIARFSKISVAAITVSVTITGTGTLFTACAHEDDIEGTAQKKDQVSPTINVLFTSMDIAGVEKIRISGNELYIGDKLVATWKDDVTTNCIVKVTFDGIAVNSGDVTKKSGTLILTVTDEAGNVKTASIRLILDEVFPNLTIMMQEVNIFAGGKVEITDSLLLINGVEVASWSDKYTAHCKVSVLYNKKEVKSGDILSGEGLLTIAVTNDQGKTSTAEMTMTDKAIYGLETLQTTSLQVDQEINLLSGLTFADGVELVKTEVEIDNKRSDIDPSHYTPSYPGKCNIIFSIKGKNGVITEIKVDNLTISPLEYKSVQIDAIKPADILPFLGQLERGDTKIYEHIEHLRIAEATRIRDMMRTYGTGKHSPEEYQQLMSRLNTGMIGENPLGYENYEVIGGELWRDPDTHAHTEWNILDNLVKHANFKIFNKNGFYENRKLLYNLCRREPNKINIMGCSVSYADGDKKQYGSHDNEKYKEYDKEKNRLVFYAGGNIRRFNGIIKRKIVQDNYDLPDENSLYRDPSRSHSKNDSKLDRHLMLTIATDKNGDIDQTNETVESSYFPVGFHDKVLFAGRGFPRHDYKDGDYGGKQNKYPTSDTNYLNVAMADLCFQMKADVKDVDELLEMMRSTALTDYIRFDLNGDGDTNDTDSNGQPETQPLQLINPAGVFLKYLMPDDLTASISMDAIAALDKGYYLGLVFDIPGAEVLINGEWTAFSDSNKELVKSHNPFSLQWRLNGDLLRKMGYKPGDTLNGTILAVDDQWNGLNLSKDFSISVTE